ncbi:MAG: hypothetical protein JSS83_16085 [Cyanobacteria bacterium SZAS LIN-3]|nr:hypothetical protein [Cyanobacteria bacterium SZAS LIN-3]MBS2010148.1 hypothetical protein [Cyanobacteria bacterium SZAS TMP-1]
MGKHTEVDEAHKPSTHPPSDGPNALHQDAYTPPLNHRVMNKDGTIQPGHCAPGPKLTDLSIDVPNVHVHDTPRRDDSYAERQAALKREVEISNPHYRELAKSGAEFLAINGGFNLQMKNALEEARQSDVSMKTGHKHVDDLLKYVNAENCGGFYTLRRTGNNIQVFDTHYSETKPQGTFNLNKRDWVR